MSNQTVETILGAVVLATAIVFLGYALNTSETEKVDGYRVVANFSQINGILPGQDVRISGVKVGSVLKTELDHQTYLAKVTLGIADDIELPTDTVAKISSEGLLGGKFLALEPGADDKMLRDGDKIEYTQAAVNLEEMIGKFIFSAADKDKDKETENPAATSDASPFPADM